jgi:hypothetical protein
MSDAVLRADDGYAQLVETLRRAERRPPLQQ